MKITYNWLKDFVDIDISPADLARQLTMAGLEVKSIEAKHKDAVYEIEITSNRPDWLSVIGIAREVAAITGKKLKLLRPGQTPGRRKKRTPDQRCGDLGQLAVSVESKKDCPLYTATIITGVKPGPSPDWLLERLGSIGCRAVNNVVDITNYCLFETGQPFHAFDLDKMSAPDVSVRRARDGERMVTIDGQEKILSPSILAICNKGKVIAAAGIMGGRETEVTNSTENILLEAAVFDPITTRRAGRELGLQSESSYRFERAVDAQALECARQRAVELIMDICGGRVVARKSRGAPPKKKRPLKFNIELAGRVLGTKLSPARSAGILKDLGFTLEKEKSGDLLVSAPSWRRDVTTAVDLVEEIARVYGYDKVPISLPAIKTESSAASFNDRVMEIKNVLVSQGSVEVITYSMLDRKTIESCGIKSPGFIQIQNPLSRDQELLRPALAPSLARCIAYNLNQKQDQINIFEIAKVFSIKQGRSDPLEELHLAVSVCGERKIFTANGVVKDIMGIRHLKGMIEHVLRRMGVQEYDFRGQGCGTSVFMGAEQIGSIFRLERSALDFFDIKHADVYIAEISLQKILSENPATKKFMPLPLYPGIERDISFLVEDRLRIRDVLGAVAESGKPLLAQACVSDYYSGKQIPPGKRSLTVSCLYRLDDRTLTEVEVVPVHEKVRSLLKERFGAELR